MTKDLLEDGVLVDELNLRRMEIHEEFEDEANPWMEVKCRPEGCRQIENLVNNIVYPVGLPA